MSNINVDDLNESFPANGKDNSTQGFRDNFSTIKQNFQFAKAEIEALESFSVSSNSNNNFNGNSLINVNLSQSTLQATTVGLNGVGIDYDVSFLFGHIHVIRVTKSLTLNFTDWPTIANFANIKLILLSDGTARQVDFTTTGGQISKHTDFPTPLVLTNDTKPVIVEAWTYDRGNNVYLDYKGTYS